MGESWQAYAVDLMALALNWHAALLLTFHWPEQVIRPSLILGREVYSFYREKPEVTQQ